MNLSTEEHEAVESFKTNPQQQEELRSFMREEGAEWGRELSALVTTRLSLEQLLSNSRRWVLS
jgi:hypothetical protein